MCRALKLEIIVKGEGEIEGCIYNFFSFLFFFYDDFIHMVCSIICLQI